MKNPYIDAARLLARRVLTATDQERPYAIQDALLEMASLVLADCAKEMKVAVDEWQELGI